MAKRPLYPADDGSEASHTVCPACQIGVLHERQGTYFRRWYQHPVVLHGVSIYQCDICENVMYNPQMLVSLSALLGSPEPDDNESEADRRHRKPRSTRFYMQDRRRST